MVTKVLRVAELKRKLARIPDAAKAEIRIAIGRAADRIVAMAKNLVPVDTGALRDSIGWTWGDAPKGSITLATAVGAKDLTATIYAGDDVAYYSRFVEWGTVNLPAQPFFFPSWRAHRKPVRAAISRAVRKAARDVAAGGR